VWAILETGASLFRGWEDYSHGPAEFLTSENPPARDFHYAAGDNGAGRLYCMTLEMRYAKYSIGTR